ncbi:hypothetical protein JCM12296A_37400 [Desulfosarcina cetonica]
MLARMDFAAEDSASFAGGGPAMATATDTNKLVITVRMPVAAGDRVPNGVGRVISRIYVKKGPG